MSTTTTVRSERCRAKEPARCRVHGTSRDALFTAERVLFDSKGAAQALAQAKASLDTPGGATSWDDHAVKLEVREGAQEAYDASPDGRASLRRALFEAKDEAARAGVQLRIARAERTREELLASNPTLQKLDGVFDSTQDASVKTLTSFPATAEGLETLRSELGDVPHGAPIAVKLHNGEYVFGRVPNAPRGKVASMLLPFSNLRNTPVYADGLDGRTDGQVKYAVNLMGNDGKNWTVLDAKNIKELRVLQADVEPRDLVSRADVSGEESRGSTSGYYMVEDGANVAFVPGKARDHGYHKGTFSWESPAGRQGYTLSFSEDAKLTRVAL